MSSNLELMGKDLARHIHSLMALKEERKGALKEFQMREQIILKEIHRLALDVQIGQSSLYMDAEKPGAAR